MRTAGFVILTVLEAPGSGAQRQETPGAVAQPAPSIGLERRAAAAKPSC